MIGFTPVDEQATISHKIFKILCTSSSPYKLNKLFGNELYSISIILETNNIKFRDGETRKMAEDLHRRGYVVPEERYRKSDQVKISVKGAAYIERKNMHSGQPWGIKI